MRILLNNGRQQGHQTPYQQRTHLCPRCTSPLVEGIFSCPQCSLEFKNRQKAKKVSIIYPGGGYFYTRHFFLGIGDAVAETYLTLLVLIALYNVILGYTSNIPVMAFIALILLIEKAISVYECNHFIAEYIPTQRRVEVFTEVPAVVVEKPDADRQPNLEQILSTS